MFFRFLRVGLIVICAVAPLARARDLRVCADPDNLPFSDTEQRGFENKIATLLAQDLNAHLVYVWQRMGRGFVREYLNKSKCDVLIGIPSDYRPVLTTTPYYRSTYVFVMRRDAPLQLTSLNDPALHRMKKIGVQVLDEEYAPPGDALARRGMQAAIAGFSSTGKDADSIIRAVVDGKVDAAIVWGPLAGYFTRHYKNVLRVAAVSPPVDPPGIPLTFAISMGVKKGNTQLRAELENFLERRHQQIQAILRHYAVPLTLEPESRVGD